MVADLADVTGGVDHLGRPLVRVPVWGRDDEALALVDTGFNGQLMCHLGDAERLGVVQLPETQTVSLGNGETVVVKIGTLRIRWLGTDRLVDVLISPRPDPVRDGPVALLGVGLLTPNLLTIDFDTGEVRIATHE